MKTVLKDILFKLKESCIVHNGNQISRSSVMKRTFR